jgi:hypothetical protein
MSSLSYTGSSCDDYVGLRAHNVLMEWGCRSGGINMDENNMLLIDKPRNSRAAKECQMLPQNNVA